MLDNSINEGGSGRRRSTFYVPLSENPSNSQDSSKSKKTDKNHLERISFSPFKKTPKKSLTPPIYETQEPTPKKPQNVHHVSASKPAHPHPHSHRHLQPNRPRVERTPVRISHLQQPQKPRTLDASKLLKTPSVSLPALDRNQESETRNVERVAEKTPKVSLVKRTDSTKLIRQPSSRISKNGEKGKVAFSDSNPSISALHTPPKDNCKSVRVPFVVVENDDRDDYVEKCGEKNYIQVVDDEDAGIHSGMFGFF